MYHFLDWIIEAISVFRSQRQQAGRKNTLSHNLCLFPPTNSPIVFNSSCLFCSFLPLLGFTCTEMDSRFGNFLITAVNVVRFLKPRNQQQKSTTTTIAMKSKLFMCSRCLANRILNVVARTMKNPKMIFETSVRGVEWFMILLQNYIICWLCDGRASRHLHFLPTGRIPTTISKH